MENIEWKSNNISQSELERRQAEYIREAMEMAKRSAVATLPKPVKEAANAAEKRKVAEKAKPNPAAAVREKLAEHMENIASVPAKADKTDNGDAFVEKLFNIRQEPDRKPAEFVVEEVPKAMEDRIVDIFPDKGWESVSAKPITELFPKRETGGEKQEKHAKKSTFADNSDKVIHIPSSHDHMKKAEPAKDVHVVPPMKPVKPVQPPKPVKPTPPEQLVQPTKPVKPAEPLQETTPVTPPQNNTHFHAHVSISIRGIIEEQILLLKQSRSMDKAQGFLDIRALIEDQMNLLAASRQEQKFLELMELRDIVEEEIEKLRNAQASFSSQHMQNVSTQPIHNPSCGVESTFPSHQVPICGAEQAGQIFPGDVNTTFPAPPVAPVPVCGEETCPPPACDTGCGQLFGDEELITVNPFVDSEKCEAPKKEPRKEQACDPPPNFQNYINQHNRAAQQAENPQAKPGIKPRMGGAKPPFSAPKGQKGKKK